MEGLGHPTLDSLAVACLRGTRSKTDWQSDTHQCRSLNKTEKPQARFPQHCNQLCVSARGARYAASSSLHLADCGTDRRREMTTRGNAKRQEKPLCQSAEQSFIIKLPSTSHKLFEQQNTNRTEGGTGEGPFIASGGLLPNPSLSILSTETWKTHPKQCNYP